MINIYKTANLPDYFSRKEKARKRQEGRGGRGVSEERLRRRNKRKDGGRVEENGK